MPHFQPIAGSAPLVLLAVFALVSCSDEGTAPEAAVATTLVAVSGGDQTAAVASELPDPLVVRVNDQNGSGMGGVTVSWTIATGGGTLSSSTTTTGPDGGSSVRFTLGTVAGEAVVRASVSGIADGAAFAASATPGEVRSIAVARDSLSFAALADTAVLAVTAADGYGNDVTGAALSWASSDAAVVTVDGSGVVTAAGNGATSVVAAAGTVADSVAVTVDQVPVEASLLGDAQTGPAGEGLVEELGVKVVDANDFGVPGVAVSWAAPDGSGTIAPASTETDGTGTATASWTLGRHAGTDTVVATVDGLESGELTFLATATPNGTISGTISLTNSLQSAGPAPYPSPRPAPDASMRGLRKGLDGLTLPADPTTTSSGPAARAAAPGPTYVDGSLLVTYRHEALRAPPAGSAAFRTGRMGAEVADRIRSLVDGTVSAEIDGIAPAILAARVRVDPRHLSSVRARLEADPAVLHVERELLIPHPTSRPPTSAPTDRRLATTPAEPFYPQQAWHYAAIDAPEAWSHGTGSRDVVVAVIDDGIRFDHPAIQGNLSDDGYDFTSSGTVALCGVSVDRAFDGDGPDPDPTIPIAVGPNCTLSTAGGHGLHVAGTIGAVGGDGVGVTGVNWNVTIRPIRVFGIEGSATAFDVANGILYAAGYAVDLGGGNVVAAPAPAHIINMSLGSSGSSTTMRNAVRAADDAGVLLVVSAGNDANAEPRYPAAYPEVVSVSAVAPNRQRASYSSFGPTVDIAAPGGEMGWGPDYGVASTTWNFDTDSPSYSWLQGTSMAAPHVAGVAALVLATDPSLSADQLRDRLLDHAIDLGAPGRDDSFGHGLVNVRNSVTRTAGPARRTYVRLLSSSTGELLSTVAADGAGEFSFGELEDGDYVVYAGEDHDDDGLIGVPGRRWGAYTTTSTARPTAITVDGAATYPASFSLGFAQEVEPNDAPGTANTLPVDGHFHGRLSTDSEADYYRVRVPTSGTYTFETSEWDGACGFAYGEDTILDLFAADGTSTLASNDDIDLDNSQYCSRITTELEAGTYYLRVTGFLGRWYRVEARAGS